MELVEVWRAANTVDDDGNPVQGAVNLWKSFQALVAPVSVAETPSDISAGITFDHTIYIRSDTPTGILSTDIIKVRGLSVPVDGVVGEWWNVYGVHVGDVINVKLKEG